MKQLQKFSRAALLGGIVMVGCLAWGTAASAAPLAASGIGAGQAVSDDLIVQVQRRGGAGVRGVRPGGGAIRGGRIGRGGGGRGLGGAGAAAIGLGILGAAIAAGAAQSQQPAYNQCWIERRPVQDAWGNFAGYRRVRVCN